MLSQTTPRIAVRWPRGYELRFAVANSLNDGNVTEASGTILLSGSLPVPDAEVLRVVVARKGKVKATEFRLRDGERGLSLFRNANPPGIEAIIAAVKTAGKQGDLAVVEIPVRVILELGLRLVPTKGGTPDDDVNRLHVEARLSRWRELVLWFRRMRIHDWFNEHATPKLAAAAKQIEETR